MKFEIRLFIFFASALTASCKNSQKDLAFRNVIVIVADDHTKKAMGNHPLIGTPNLFTLASESAGRIILPQQA